MKKYKPLLHVVLVSFLFGLMIFSAIRCSDPNEEDGPIVRDDPISVTHQFTIDNAGGEFLLPSGILVTIPEGAVTESKEIEVNNLILEEAQALDSIITSDNSPFLFGITISTDNFNFKKPIIVRIPVQKIDENGLPVLYELQGEKKSWEFSDEEMIVSNEEKYVEIILKKSTQEKSLKDPNGSNNAVRIFLSQFYTGVFGIDGSILLPENPCRKLRFSTIVKNIDIDNSGGGCEGKTVIESYTYLDCKPAINGYYQIAKISPSCKPQVTISAPEKLEMGELGTISISITLGDNIPLPEQEINLVGKTKLTVSPSSQTTGSEGEAPSFKVQAGDEAGDGLVTGTVSLDYYTTFISVYDSETGDSEGNGEDYDHVKKDNDVIIGIKVIGLPELYTTFSTNPEGNIAIIGGEVTEDWEEEVEERGVYLNDEKIPLGKGLGSFSTERQDFEQGIINKVKAYATNQFGTTYGEEIRFVVDIDANIYTVVTINEQDWIGQNLKTTRLNDGTSIPLLANKFDWDAASAIGTETPAYSWYNNDINNKLIYGALYNWYTVDTGKLCPKGWHVPSKEEYIALAEFAGGEDIAGGKLKEKGTTHWQSPNTGATNEFGLTALPGGIRTRVTVTFDFEFAHIGRDGNWWTGSNNDKVRGADGYGYVNYVSLHSYDEIAKLSAMWGGHGMSVLCVKD